MKIASEAQALDILNDMSHSPELRVKAARYLGHYPSAQAIRSLVQALQDDDFGVRWDAAEALAECGAAALPDMLKALVDPKRVGDPRVRNSIYHALHEIDDPELRAQAADLMEALRGPAAGIAAMMAASQLLSKLAKKSATRTQAVNGRQRISSA